MMLYAHETLRSMGYPGFLNQTHVWLGRRVDVDLLRRAVSKLGERHPVFVSHISMNGRRPCWRAHAGHKCTVTETSIEESDDDGVLRFAEALLVEPMELSRSAPISFHLLHLRDGRDVFLIHNDHTLMDANGALPLLVEIARLAAGNDERADRTAAGALDPLRKILQDAPWRQRLKAVRYRRSVRSFISRHATMTLVDQELRPPCIKSLSHKPLWHRFSTGETHGLQTRATLFGIGTQQRLAIRLLDEGQTDFFLERVRRLGGLPSPSMALLASAFRAVNQLAGPGSAENARLKVTVGTNLRSRRGTAPVFCNLASVLELSVAPNEVEDRDALCRLLTKQLRERIQRGYDLGHLQVAAWFAGFRRLVRRRSLRRLTKDHSLIYGYVNWPEDAVNHFCGAPITRVHQPVGVWSPPGLALSANRCAGRLSLTATYTPESVPESRVQRFLDGVVQDMLDE